jgi:hypothetical protein
LLGFDLTTTCNTHCRKNFRKFVFRITQELRLLCDGDGVPDLPLGSR